MTFGYLAIGILGYLAIGIFDDWDTDFQVANNI